MNRKRRAKVNRALNRARQADRFQLLKSVMKKTYELCLCGGEDKRRCHSEEAAQAAHQEASKVCPTCGKARLRLVFVECELQGDEERITIWRGETEINA